jgi:hypothetical protein
MQLILLLHAVAAHGTAWLPIASSICRTIWV